MFHKPTLLEALAASAFSLAASVALAADAPTFSGKAHILFVPVENQKGLNFGDRSKDAGLSVSTQGADANGNLSVNLSGKTEKGRNFPQNFNLNNLTQDGYVSELGLSVFIPPSCVGVDGVCSDDRVLLSSDKAGAATLNNSQYGLAGRGADDARGLRNNWYGAGYFGAQTPVDQMTALKTNKIKANYEGGFIGILLDNHRDGLDAQNRPAYITEGSFLTGNTKIQADFKNGNVTGKIDGITLTDNPDDSGSKAIDQGIYMTAKIKGNAYSGTASILKGTGANKGGGSVSKSAINGGFFGPNAAETTGALRLEGKITPTSGGVALRDDDGTIVKNKAIGIVGSFGAVKK